MIATAPAKTLLCRRVHPGAATQWAGGILTDFALRFSEVPDPSCLFVENLVGASAWRDLARELQTRPPKLLLFRATHPAVERHARRWGASETHRDPLGPRYVAAGSKLQLWISHFAHANPAP